MNKIKKEKKLDNYFSENQLKEKTDINRLNQLAIEKNPLFYHLVVVMITTPHLYSKHPFLAHLGNPHLEGMRRYQEQFHNKQYST